MKDYVPVSFDEEPTIPPWVAFCGQLAPFMSIALFLSPIPTIRQIVRTGTVGDLPLLPYTSMVTSCFVWIVYGILKREPMIWVTNIVEFILSVYYFVEFTNYAPKQSPTFPGSVHRHIQLCIGIWAISLFIAAFFSNRVTAIGDLTVALSIITFASPLAAVKAVFEAKSSDSIPWPFTLAALLNCSLWSIVGIFEMHDGYVAAPEVLGLVFSLLQIALKLYFGENMNNADNPSYMRAPTAPVEMPYPVLGSVRSVVMLGNSNYDSGIGSNIHTSFLNPFHDRPMEHHDLQLDTHGGDYADLGIPLAGDQRQPYEHPQKVTAPSIRPPTGGDEIAFHSGPSHVHHRHDNFQNDEEGLEGIVFGDDSEIAPIFPNPLSESFRSRNNGGLQHGLQHH